MTIPWYFGFIFNDITTQNCSVTFSIDGNSFPRVHLFFSEPVIYKSTDLPSGLKTLDKDLIFAIYVYNYPYVDKYLQGIYTIGIKLSNNTELEILFRIGSIPTPTVYDVLAHQIPTAMLTDMQLDIIFSQTGTFGRLQSSIAVNSAFHIISTENWIKTFQELHIEPRVYTRFRLPSKRCDIDNEINVHKITSNFIAPQNVEYGEISLGDFESNDNITYPIPMYFVLPVDSVLKQANEKTNFRIEVTFWGIQVNQTDYEPIQIYAMFEALPYPSMHQFEFNKTIKTYYRTGDLPELMFKYILELNYTSMENHTDLNIVIWNTNFRFKHYEIQALLVNDLNIPEEAVTLPFTYNAFYVMGAIYAISILLALIGFSIKLYSKVRKRVLFTFDRILGLYGFILVSH